MFGTKRDIKHLMKAGAKAQGITYREYREMLMETILSRKDNEDPYIRKEFESVFGNSTPTPEEYFSKIVKKMKI